MKKTFRFKFKVSALVSGLACICVLIASIIFCSVVLFNWNYAENPSSIVAAISLVTSCVILVFVTIVFAASRYSLGKQFYVYIGVFRTAVSYDKILLLRTNSDKSILLLYYNVTAKDGTEKTTFISINVSDFDSFISSLRKKNSRIVYDVFSQED